MNDFIYFQVHHLSSPSSSSSQPMNNNNKNNNNNNNSLIPTFTLIRNDFCSWIRGHEKLYQCLLKIKHLNKQCRFTILSIILIPSFQYVFLIILFLLYYCFIVPTKC